MNTIYVALAVFGMAALVGLYLLSLVLRNKTTPKSVAFIHGLFAVVGVILLIVYCTRHDPGPVESLIIFILAALGGVVLIFRDLTTGKVPKWLAVTHGLIAVAGYIALILFATGG